MESNSKVIWVDYIRVIATFWVIVLHSAAPLLYKYNELPRNYWMIGNIYDSAVRMCVPLFFMLSGFLLLEKDEPLGVFFAKRFNKVIFPLFVWSLFYVFWKIYYEGSSELSLYSLYSIALSPAYYHLWFLYAIIGVYLVVPILRVIVRHANNTKIYYYLCLWFFAVSIIPLGEKIIGATSAIDLLAISGFSGYLIVGLLLGKREITRKMAFAAAALSFFCIIITIGITYWETARDGFFTGYYYGYLAPNVVLLTVAIFVLIKYIVTTVDVFSNERILSIIQSFSSASLGIYLVHAMVLYILSEGRLGFSLSGFRGNPIVSIPLTATVAFLLSYLFVTILRRIPILRRITP